MFHFNLQPRFIRRYAKLVKHSPALEAEIESVLERLADNPRNPDLKSHKVSAWDKRLAFSSSVTGDLRVIWRYSKTDIEVLDLIDIGGHSGSKKVYR